MGAYVWWREARNEAGYLDGLYDEAGINSKSTGNRPNFSPLIKLVWNIKGNESNASVAQWNAAMRLLDEEYNENTKVYRSDPNARLVSFILDNGGLSNLRRAAGELDDEEDVEPSTKQKRKRNQAKDAKTQAEEIKDGIKQLKSSAKPKARVKLDAPVVTTKDDLVVVVARRNKAGELELLDTTDDDEIVASVAAL